MRQGTEEVVVTCPDSVSWVWFVSFVSKCFVKRFHITLSLIIKWYVKWLDNQIIWYWISSLCLIIKGLYNQAQKINYQINQYPQKSLIVILVLELECMLDDCILDTHSNSSHSVPPSLSPQFSTGTVISNWSSTVMIRWWDTSCSFLKLFPRSSGFTVDNHFFITSLYRKNDLLLWGKTR